MWPADVLAGLGEGNGIARASIIEKALATGPMGTKLPAGRRVAGVPIPRAPAPFRGAYMAPPAASGGRARDHGGPVDIMAVHRDAGLTFGAGAAQRGLQCLPPLLISAIILTEQLLEVLPLLSEQFLEVLPQRDVAHGLMCRLTCPVTVPPLLCVP